MSAPEKIYIAEILSNHLGLIKMFDDDIEYIRSDLYEKAVKDCKRHEEAVEFLLASAANICINYPDDCTQPHGGRKDVCIKCWKAYAYKEAV